MLGSIIGDIIGSQYEISQYQGAEKIVPYELIDSKSFFTDDTVCTIAIADAMLNEKDFTATMIEWTKGYPNKGYGGMFREWMRMDVPTPYKSYGNGGAMRISVIPYLSKTIDECISLTNQATEITHNHPEGLKSAECVTTLMYKILNDSCTKKECKEYVKTYYPEIDTFDLEDLHKNYAFEVTAMKSVPQAIFCFLESNNYESTIRNCLYIGGDVDTIAAIAGGIAEAFYKEIPEEFIKQSLLLLGGDMKLIINQFIENIKN